jgi:hypothetical protein
MTFTIMPSTALSYALNIVELIIADSADNQQLNFYQ